MQKDRTPELLDSFIQDCHYRNLSKKAIEDYKWFLTDAQNRLGNLTDISRDDIKQLVLERIESGLSPATVNHYIRIIKIFYSYLEREEIIRENPMMKLKQLSVPKRLKPVVDSKHISRLVAMIPDEGFYHIRDRSMILLLWDTAIRLNEILTISLENVDLQFRTIKIIGKGNKERIVPFGNKTKRALQKYLKIRENHSPLLFCTKEGVQIMRRNFQRTVQRYGKRIGLNISPHLIRHSAATFLAKSEMPAQHIQILLGHSNLNTTQRYINQIVNQEGLQISHRRLSPGDRI